MPTFVRLRGGVTPPARAFYNFVWEHYLAHQAWPSTWHVYRAHLEKPKLVKVLTGASSALFAENPSSSPKTYELRLAGILCTTRGNDYRQWFVGLLAYLRDRFYGTEEQLIITQAEVKTALSLSDADAGVLGRILQQGVFSMHAVWQPGASGWQLYLPGHLVEDFSKIGSLKSAFGRLLDTQCQVIGKVYPRRAIPPLATNALARMRMDDLWGEQETDRSRRYQVFVSSTYKDLKDERRRVIQALLESRCIPAGMELFPAASIQQWKLIQDVIAESDYYLVIVAGRYGECPPGSRISYTEREFDHARKIGKPILAFYHDAPGTIPRDFSEKSAAGQKRLDRFIAKVKQNRMCKAWLEPAELPGVVKSAIQHAIDTQPQSGWIRAS